MSERFPRLAAFLARLAAPDDRPLEPYAKALVAAALVLMAIGVTMVYSASSAKAGLRFDDPELFLRRQLVWVVLGVAALAWTMRCDPHAIRRWSKPAVVVTVVLLALVLVPGLGTVTNGARRWFRLGPVSFQPSEAAKIVLVVWLAHHLALASERLDDWKRGVLPAVVPVGVAAALVLVEPDLGTAIFLGAVCASVMLVGGVPWRRLAVCSLPAVPLLGWQVIRRWDVMVRRFAAVGGGEPNSDATHQVYQAKIAMGSGGLFGVGIGAGNQKLAYLPEAHTDFILPVVGEELGFAGTSLVVLLFCALTLCGLRIAMGCASRDRYGFLLVFGAVFATALQAAGNVAVVTGSVPTKGIALPFISLGGSSLIVLCAGIGLVYAVARRHDMAVFGAPAATAAPQAPATAEAAPGPLATTARGGGGA